MTRYAEIASEKKTSQGQKARDEQVANSAGGYVFTLDKWSRLDRFLILGSDAPTYYAKAQTLTQENAACLRECIAEDGPKTVARIAAISDAGRAPKNDPAIFALAVCAASKDDATRRAALAAIPRVCRIGTHILHFGHDVQHFRGWGPALRRAVGAYYTAKSAEDLAYDLVKYQQRDGFAQRDLLRLAHPKAPTPAHKAALAWSAHAGDVSVLAKRKGSVATRGTPGDREALPKIMAAFEQLHAGPETGKTWSTGEDIRRACKLIADNRLPHECVPNELKAHAAVWEAMLPHMGLTALMRNLNKLTAVGLLKPLSKATEFVAGRLTDSKRLYKARVHPLNVLISCKTYASGRGVKGGLTWEPLPAITDALDAAFYLSFEAIEPTSKNILLALDVSGSMGDPISGTVLTCREASAAMAMVVARAEKSWHCVGFTAGSNGYGGRWGGSASGLTPLDVSPRQRLDSVIKSIEKLPMGGTDCALPMLYATKQKLDVDAFAVLTDNETWAGDVHPFQALGEYRRQQGKPQSKLIVWGMTATGFSIADPSDPLMLDVVGFDAAAPGVMADFIAGRGVSDARTATETEEVATDK